MSTQSSPLAAALVNGNCGLAFGYAIGIFAVINSYQTDLSACDEFTAKSACDGANYIGKCEWVPNKPSSKKHSVLDFDSMTSGDVFELLAAGKNNSNENDGKCVYADDAKAKCAKHKTSGPCASAPEKCAWNKDHKNAEGKADPICEPTGEKWSAVLVGLYSTLFVIGCTLGGPLAPMLLGKGRRPTLGVMGVFNLVGQIMLSVGWHYNSYAVQVIGRVLGGVGGGIACVVGPIYAEETQGRHTWIGCLFQLGCVFGIALAAVMGAALDPSTALSPGSRFGAGAHTQEVLQGTIHFGTFLILIIFPVIFIAPESLKSATAEEADEVASVNKQQIDITKAEEEEAAQGSKGKQILKYLIPIIAVCGAQQLTGINAIMNYAPEIMKNAGVKPLIGNLYVMLWNLIVTPISIPLVSRVKPKKIYYICASLVTVACFLTFIPSYPGIITNKDASNALNLLAIFFFVAAFAIGVGPCFFILAADMFPKHLQDLGTSITITVTMTFNVIINFGFPVLVKLFAGKDNDQAKGFAFTFLIFGVCGVVSCLTMFKTVPKLRSEYESEYAEVATEE